MERITTALRKRGKLTPELAESIRKDNRPQAVIAHELGIDPSTVSRVKSGQYWGGIHFR